MGGGGGGGREEVGIPISSRQDTQSPRPTLPTGNPILPKGAQTCYSVRLQSVLRFPTPLPCFWGGCMLSGDACWVWGGGADPNPVTPAPFLINVRASGRWGKLARHYFFFSPQTRHPGLFKLARTPTLPTKIHQFIQPRPNQLRPGQPLLRAGCPSIRAYPSIWTVDF